MAVTLLPLVYFASSLFITLLLSADMASKYYSGVQFSCVIIRVISMCVMLVSIV